MFAGVFVLLAIVVVLFLPLVYDNENRILWFSRMRQCRWIPLDRNASNSTERAPSRTGVSRETLEQEEAVREALVDEQLMDYTQASAIQVTDDALSTSQQHRSSIVHATTLGSGGGGTSSSSSASDEGDSTTALRDVETGKTDTETASATNANPASATRTNSPDDHTQVTPSPTAMIQKLISFATTNVTSLDNSRHSVGVEISKPSFLDCSRNGRVWVPKAGTSTAQMRSADAQQEQRRQGSSTCAICLSAFATGDSISWASNTACPHLFHTVCIKDWLLASGRKHVQRQRRRGVQPDTEDFPMLCPCCRQPFICSSPSPSMSPATEETSSIVVSHTEEEEGVENNPSQSQVDEKSSRDVGVDDSVMSAGINEFHGIPSHVVMNAV